VSIEEEKLEKKFAHLSNDIEQFFESELNALHSLMHRPT
jgi:hypothetical protein